MNRLLAAISFLAASWSPAALAEGPTGFAGFPWGTPVTEITEKLVKQQCKWHLRTTTVKENTRVVCTEYHLKEFGPVDLWLEFMEDRLRGYVIIVPRRLLANLRTATREMLRTPASAAPPTGQRVWETTVEFSDNCLASLACLIVNAH